MVVMRDRVARVVGAALGALAAGLFLSFLFCIQWGADRLVLLVSDWLFGAK